MAAPTWPGWSARTRARHAPTRPAIGCRSEQEPFAGREPNDTLLWIESHRAVISGDTLVDFGQGLEIPSGWLRDAVTREQIVDQLSPLLELPVEHVLATHGGPTDRAALERALS